MKTIQITTEYITLGQLLKFIGLIREGYEAKAFLQEQNVQVDGEKEERRGKKLYNGAKVFIKGVQYVIKSDVLSK